MGLKRARRACDTGQRTTKLAPGRYCWLTSQQVLRDADHPETMRIAKIDDELVKLDARRGPSGGRLSSHGLPHLLKDFEIPPCTESS